MKLAKDFPILELELGKAAARSESNVNKLCRLTGTTPAVAEGTSGVKRDSFRQLAPLPLPLRPFLLSLWAPRRPGEGRARGWGEHSSCWKREVGNCGAAGPRGSWEELLGGAPGGGAAGRGSWEGSGSRRGLQFECSQFGCSQFGCGVRAWWRLICKEVFEVRALYSVNSISSYINFSKPTFSICVAKVVILALTSTFVRIERCDVSETTW